MENEFLTDTDNAGSFDTLLAQFLEKIEIPSIKSSFKDNLVINRITSDTIYLITISKIADMVLKNQSHMRYLEDIFSKVLGNSIAIHTSFENKESYFAKKLENK